MVTRARVCDSGTVVSSPEGAEAAVTVVRTVVTDTGVRAGVLPEADTDDLTPQITRYARRLLDHGLTDARFLLRSRTHGWCWTTLTRAHRGVLVEARLGAAPYGLTGREVDVLTLLAGGLPNTAIAERLQIGRRTVATHVDHLLVKLGQQSRTGAAAVAVDRGLLLLPLPGSDDGQRPELSVALLDVRPGLRPPAGRPRRSALGRRPHPVLVGTAVPLSGPAAPDGQEMLNGSALAVAEINEHGGVAGRPVQQIVVDIDVFSTTGVRTALRQLAQHGVDAVCVGYALTEDVAPAALAVDYRCPIVNSMTAEVQAQWVQQEPERLGHVFQLAPTEVHHARAFVSFLDELVADGRWRPPGRDLVLVQTDVVGGQIVDDQVVDQIQRSGWRVREVIQVAVTDADWEPTLAAAGGAGVAATFVAHFVPGEVSRLAREFSRRLVASGATSLLYTVWSPSVPGFLDLTGEDAEGMVWGTTTGVYGDVVGQRFTSRYRRRFGTSPGRALAGTAYDQVHLLARAWAEAGASTRFDDVVDALRHTVHRGVNGSYYFGHGRQCGLSYPFETPDPSLGQAHLVFQVQDGAHRIVYPRLYAESVFRPPARAATSVI